MEISQANIKGLGPKKAHALQTTGIRTAQDLAEVDLRTFQGMEGISKENLKVLKQRARAVCRQEGIAFETTAYTMGHGTALVAKQETTSAASGNKRGLFGMFRRKK